jgi:hypothetical protein
MKMSPFHSARKAISPIMRYILPAFRIVCKIFLHAHTGRAYSNITGPRKIHLQSRCHSLNIGLHNWKRPHSAPIPRPEEIWRPIHVCQGIRQIRTSGASSCSSFKVQAQRGSRYNKIKWKSNAEQPAGPHLSYRGSRAFSCPR